MESKEEKQISKIMNNIRPTFTPGIWLLRLTGKDLQALWAMYKEWKKGKV